VTRPRFVRQLRQSAVALAALLLALAGGALADVAVPGSGHASVAAGPGPVLGPYLPVVVAAARPVPAAPVAQPTRLSIPSIGVSSALLQLGLTSTGALAMPQPGPHYDQAGWYRGSPRPGAVGPAVLAGHVDSARDGASVFYRLHELRPGDLVLIARADGSTVTFAVDRVARYPKNRFPTALVYGDTATPELRLITCGGPFDRRTGHYLENTVVSAHLADRNSARHRVVVQASTSIR
jgi:sortase (surface protein transpeptidase)